MTIGLMQAQVQQAEQIQDLETQDIIPVVARASTAAAQNLTNNTVTVIDFDTIDIDTYSAVTAGAGWVFTAPVAGYYRVSSQILFAGTTAWAVGELCRIMLYKNTALYSVLDYNNSEAGGTVYRGIGGTDIISLAKGDVIDIRVNQVSGGALALFNSAPYCFVAIQRI